MALADIVNAAVVVKAEVDKLTVMRQDFDTHKARAQALQAEVQAQQAKVDQAVATLKGLL